MNFQGRTVLVTGGTRGIGRGIVQVFATAGAQVAVNGTKIDLCKEAAEEADSLGGKGLAVPGDISKYESVRDIFKEVYDAFGELDILVNNAGVVYIADCTDTTEKQWDRTFDVNCRGVFLCSREASRHMIKRGSGKIVNLSSMLGKTGIAHYSHYCASKFAVVGFTQALARELAPHGINVNAVCPGIVDTDMMKEELAVLEKIMEKSEEDLRKEFLNIIPMGRYETVNDVANLIMFLASEEAAYITGQSINVTGGIEVH